MHTIPPDFSDFYPPPSPHHVGLAKLNRVLLNFTEIRRLYCVISINKLRNYKSTVNIEKGYISEKYPIT